MNKKIYIIPKTCSEHIIMAALREAFYQYFDRLSYLAPVGLQRQLVLERDDFIESSHLLLLRDIIRQMFLCIRARPLGVFEHESRVKPYFPHQTEGLRMILQRLIMESAEDIRADGCGRQNTADSRDAL